MADADLQSSRALTREGVQALYAIATALEVLAPSTLGVTTVASLPSSPAQGDRRLVTDANATTFASVVAAGGANVVPVYYDGSAWRIG